MSLLPKKFGFASASSARRSFEKPHETRIDEQLAKAGVEDQLGWHPGVAATENGGIRMLALKEICENLLLHGGESRGPGDESFIARFEAEQCFVG